MRAIRRVRWRTFITEFLPIDEPGPGRSAPSPSPDSHHISIGRGRRNHQRCPAPWGAVRTGSSIVDRPHGTGQVFSHLNPTAYFAGVRRGRSLSQSNTGARHRAARRPITPLHTLGHVVTGPAGRRTAVAAASSGLVLTLTAGASLAAVQPNVRAAQPGTAPTAALAVPGANQIKTEPTVSVDSDTEWSFVTDEVSAEAPEPLPEPEPRVAPVSRSNNRSAAPAPAAAAPAEKAPVGSEATPSASGNAIVDIARRYVGTPYVHGGSTPSGFDCSGFTQYVFAQLGISLPRSSGAQRGAGRVVSASEARPGDLVWAPGHVGIYTGGGNHIAARQPGTPLYESVIYMSNPTFIRVTG
ncbi:glycoside hydrolase [Pseudactinotalea sp. HY158]|nr:glycoside hydrolase [Pseudactinotalea sp. HY158]